MVESVAGALVVDLIYPVLDEEFLFIELEVVV